MLNTPWLLIGDFNDIVKPFEEFGGGGPPSENKIATFNNFLNSCGLVDLGFVGPPFNWTDGRLGNHIIRSRIDRAHVNFEWVSLFPDNIVFYLPRPRSDHCPILLKTHNFPNTSQKPFHFETMWMSHIDFKDLVNNSWNQHHLPLNDIIVNFTQNLSSWNKKLFKIFTLKRKGRLLGLKVSKKP